MNYLNNILKIYKQLFLLLYFSFLQGDIVITEFFIKPDKELDQIPAYIELFNNDTIAIDLEGWSISIYNHLDS